MQKNWFTVFNVRVTARAYITKIWLFLLYLLNCWLFATKLGLIVQDHKPECPVEKWDYCIQGQGHSEGSKCQWMYVRMIFTLYVRLCLLNISWTTTRFNWMVHLHKLECLVWKLDYCFQGQDHSESSKLDWIFMYLIYSVPLISLQPKKVCLYTIHSNQTKYTKVGIYWQ